ncbi:MAG: lytic murein transglycosylase B [Thiohalomonadaceae bacterium]
MNLRRIFAALLLCSAAFSCHGRSDLNERAEVRAFIDEMVQQHAFSRSELEQLFRAVELRPDIIAAITRPAESKPWHTYRPIFLTEERIRGGVAFWRENEALLQQAQQRYGVAPQYIVAILGVETRYGRFRGHYRVMDALATLAFDYPPRGGFFRSELQHYLLLTREETIAPLSLTGSYAGAMGTPQFIPSSFRHYAVDFDGDGRRDLFNSVPDIIGSVANYFKVHGWINGGTITVPATVSGTGHKPLLDAGLKPHIAAGELGSYGVIPRWGITATAPVALLALEGEQGVEHWVTFNNFYVITRYNRSPLYAMAVHQLSEAIRKAKNTSTALAQSDER